MRTNLFKMLLVSLIILSSCSKKEEEQTAYNPNQPVVISRFSPDTGPAAAKIVITGENFGSDTSLVKVTIGGKAAAVIGVSPNKIYALSPRRLEPTNSIEVTIGEQHLVFEKQFRYQLLQTVSTLSGKVNADGSGGAVDGSLAQATFNDPKYLNIDQENILFVMQYATSKNLRLVDILQNKVSTIPSGVVKSFHGMAIRKSDNTPIIIDRDGDPKLIYTLPPFNSWLPNLIFQDQVDDYSWPADIAYDQEREIFYVQDYTFGKILAIDAITMNSLGEIYRTGANELTRLALDKDGKLYIARTASHHIVKFDPETKKAEVFAGEQGVAGSDDGLRLYAHFRNPEQMVFDESGNLYIADSGNHCIRKIDLNGEVTLYAGQPGNSGYSDGLPKESLFNQPTGLALDSEGVLYVADWKNHRIRTIIVE